MESIYLLLRSIHFWNCIWFLNHQSKIKKLKKKPNLIEEGVFNNLCNKTENHLNNSIQNQTLIHFCPQQLLRMNSIMVVISGGTK
jgi:hypothetical protein